MLYQILNPDGETILRDAKAGMTHAVIRKYETTNFFRVSLASSLGRAQKELKSRSGVDRGLIVEIDDDGKSNSMDVDYVVFDSSAMVPGIADPYADTWELAFKAGKEYALHAVFHGRSPEPMNPYK